jgi:hypothetical protein
MMNDLCYYIPVDNASCHPKNYKTCCTGELIIETSKQLYFVDLN